MLKVASFRGVLLIANLVIAANAESGDPCSWGPSYRCGDLRAVSRCNTVVECQENGWKNSPFLQDTSLECQYCSSSLVQQIRDFIADQKTNAEISRLVGDTCRGIADHQRAEECKALADIYIGAAIQLVRANVDPEIACGLLKFCRGDAAIAGAKANRMAPGDSVSATPRSEPAGGGDDTSSSGGNPICEDCLTFFVGIQDLVLANTTELELEKLVNNHVCARLGAAADECQALVSSQVSALLRSIADSLAPTMICNELGCCSAVSAAAGAAKPLQCLSPDGQAINYSLLCSSVTQQVEKNRDIETFVETKICAAFGSRRTNCKTLTMTIARPLIETVVRSLNLGSLCRRQLIGGGNAGGGRAVSREADLLSALTDSLGLGNTPDDCGVCVVVGIRLRDLLMQFGLQALNMENLVERVCNTIPVSALGPACRLILPTINLQDFLSRLKSNEDPSLICKDLNLCSKLL